MTTLDTILAKQRELEALIATLQKPEDVQPTYFEYLGTRYELERGETYVCTLASSNFAPYHTILLPFDSDDATWNEQIVWAKGEGCDLPNRLELLTMWMTMRSRFHATAYWSCDVYQDNSAYAWFQRFDYGSQNYGRKSAALRAVAVRRLEVRHD